MVFSVFVEAGVVAAFSVLVEVSVVVLSRAVLQLAVGGFDVGGIVDARGVRSCVTFTRFSFRLYHNPHHPSLLCLELFFHLFFVIIVHVPDAWRSDGVTVASKSLNLALIGCFGDVNSCLWLVNVAHAHLMQCSNSSCTAFLKVMSCPRCSIDLSGSRIWMFIP